MQKYSPLRKRLLAFWIPVAMYICVMIFTHTIPFGKESMLLWDAWEQDSAFLPYWHGVLLGQHDALYSLSRGLGGGMAGMIGFYLASPLNLLLLLFPAGAFPLSLSVLILVRIGLCGLTFYIFLEKVYHSGAAGLFFAVIYALMGTIAAYAFRIMWLDAYVLLPLVALGIVQLIKAKKPWLYIAALWMTLVSNYYMGYMVCLFAVLYFIYRLLQTRANGPMPKGEFIKLILYFAGASMLAGALAAVLILPVILSLSQGYTLFDSSLLRFSSKFSVAGILTKFYTGAMSITQLRDGLPNLYIGIPVLLFLPLYFFNRAIPLKKRLISAGLLLVFFASLLIKGLYYAWHAFEQPTYYAARFTFVISFVLIEIAWQGYSELRNMAPRRRKTVSAVAVAGFLVMTYALFHNFVIDYLAMKTIIMDAVIFGIAGAIIAWNPIGKRRRMMILVFCLLQAVCLLLNSYYPIVRLRQKDYTTAAEYTQTTGKTQALVDRVQAEDDGLYRMESNDPYTHNDPLLYGYKGLTHSNSDLSGTFMAFAKRLGFQEIIFRTKYGNGISPVLESLFGFRYVLQTDAITHGALPKWYTKLWSADGVTAYKNGFALPLAYTVPLEETELADTDPFINQNKLLRDVSGTSVDVFEPIRDIDRTYDGTWETYMFPVQANQTAYLWSMGTLYRMNGGEVLTKEHYNGTVSLPLDTQDQVIGLQMTYPLGVYLAYFDADAFEAAYAVLAAHAADVTSDTDSHLVITTDVTDDFSQLLITVPYDKGWHVTVDGEPTETTARYGTLLAVNLPQGTHTVELRYSPPGLWAGVGISVAGLMILVLWMLWRRRKNASPLTA